MIRPFGLAGSVLCMLAVSMASADEPIDADIILKGGTIHDGTGGRPRTGDVAIRGERIVAVGEFPVGQANQILDCRGLVIAPGFIDLHNHSDGEVTASKTRGVVNYLMQGCTTVVTGNCGSGPTDVGAYYRKIDAAGAGTNVAHLLPQGALRSRVMQTAHRKPTGEELQEMRQLAEQAMQDGAWGMSTGLIYVPSSYAETDELIELARVVAAHGGIYASHIRGEGSGVLGSVEEALKIGREAGLPVHVSHFKSSGQDAWGLVRRAAERIEQARGEGQAVTADQYPYVASSTSLEATLIPTWARSGGQKALVARLEDPEQSERILREMKKDLTRCREGESLRIARYSPRPNWVGKTVAQIAEEENATPLEVALQITRNGGASIVNFSMSEEDVRHIMQVPWVATASDGSSYVPNATKPHPRSYGTFPRKIGHYALRENVLPLEQAIRSSSGLPADILRMADRGYIKPEAYADLVVFDPQEFIDTATFDEPHQYASGARYVFVNGTPAVYNGTPTGALAGRALKHAGTEAGGQ